MDIFARPSVPGLMRMSRSQVNEMCWAVRHLKKGLNLSGEVKPGFWVRYAKAMKFMDANADVKTLSNFSPGALQKMFKIMAPNYAKISKEVFKHQKNSKKLSIEDANKDDRRIY